MRTLRQRVAPWWIGGVTATLAASCARQPSAAAPGPAAVVRGSAPVTAGSVEFRPTEAGPFAHVEEMLAGRVAGLDVLRRANGSLSLRIRGPGSFLSSSPPLIVIDGMPIDGDGGDPLAGVSPLDVQRVAVLKDVEATAIYGSRGANGVVVITTRRPH